MSDSSDPVLDVLQELKKNTSENIAPLISGYEKSGVDGVEQAWGNIIKDITDED